MNNLNLAEIDPSGSIEEAHAAVEGDTRMDFFKKAGLGGASVLGGGALLAAFADSASAAGRPPSSFGKGDVGILNYALTLEYLEAAFYNQATANLAGLGLDPMFTTFLNTVTRDENKHVTFLRGALKSAGAKVAKKPNFDFKDTVTDGAKFKATAQVLENTGVHAYLGQAGNLKNKTFLGAAGSILTIEARHASVIGFLNEMSSKGIAPDGAFDTPFSAAKVLKAVKGTGFIV